MPDHPRAQAFDDDKTCRQARRVIRQLAELLQPDTLT
jgi:hypothetical protein